LIVSKYEGKVGVGSGLMELKNVIAADNMASNGVAHIIDGVMLPPADEVVV